VPALPVKNIFLEDWIMKRMKNLMVLALTLLFFMVLSGHVFAAGGGQTQQQGGTLRMWTFLDPANPTNPRATVLSKLIKQFEANHVGAKVVVEPQDWTVMPAKFYAAHAAGNAPDVVMVNTVNLGEGIKIGCFEPFENLFMKNWTKDQINDYDNAMFRLGTDDGKHYQFPMFITLYSIVYREDLFKQFNIDPNFKTWDDLVKAAQTLTFTDKNGLQVWGFGSAYSLEASDFMNYLINVFISQDGAIFKSDGTPNNWTGPAGQRALQYQIDMIDRYKITPASSISTSGEDLYNNFSAGQCAMCIISSVRVPALKANATYNPNDIQLMGFPALEPGKGPGKSNLAGWHLGVWKNGKQKNLAGDFIESLINANADTLWVTEGVQLPIRQSTSRLKVVSDFFAKPENAWMRSAAQIMASNSWCIPANVSSSGLTNDIQQVMLDAYVDKAPIQQALQNASDAFTARNVRR
jgi:multiple sugar transport system substrate-binding protein